MKPKKYNRGIIRKTPAGRFQAEVNYSNKRRRKNCRTEPQARAWIDAQRIIIDNLERPLDAFELREARKAISLLPPGASLLEAVNFFIAAKAPRQNIRFDSALSQFLDEKDQAGLRPRSIQGMKNHLERLGEFIKNPHLNDITSALLHSFLSRIGAQGITRNNYRRSFRCFFRWCQKAGYIAGDPTEAITTSKIDLAPPAILRHDQVRTLMSNAAKTPLCAYYALGFFAGLRPAEIRRLEWESIDEYIHIGAKVAKTRRQRFVTILPNLAQWIRKTRKQGPIINVSDTRFREISEEIQKKSRITPWPNNAARHSFASHHLALYQDAPRTAHELGHTSPDMLYRHYRNLVTQENAKLYFEITPSKLLVT